jgi:hypothetical protein
MARAGGFNGGEGNAAACFASEMHEKLAVRPVLGRAGQWHLTGPFFFCKIRKARQRGSP